TVLEDLYDRLGKTRWPDEVEGAQWNYGADLTFVRRLVEHWRNRFDWRRQEREINGYPQFLAKIEGEALHFVHVRGEGETPIPLLLANGWPSCFYELLP